MAPGERRGAGALGRLLRRRRDETPRTDPSTPQPPGPDAPVLTVVMPVHNTAEFLDEALQSIRAQTLTEFELICIDDGSTDTSPQILARHAAEDPRIRLLHQANAGQGTARNVAIAQARGEFLTFCDSDDTVPPGAYQRMVAGLRRSGSDFVLGRARRFSRAGIARDSYPEVHTEDRTGVDLAGFPVAMRDIIACNRVFRTAFWREQVGSFPEGMAYEDHLPMLQALLRADRFDVLNRITYNWRMRDDGASTGQQKHSTANLRDRLVSVEQARAVMADQPAVVLRAWQARVLDIDLAPYLPHAAAADDEYRTLLAGAYADFLTAADAATLAGVRLDRKVLGWLATQGRWAEFERAAVALRERSGPPACEVVGDALRPVHPPAGITDLPEELRRLGSSETVLVAPLRVVGAGAGVLTVHGVARVPGLDTAENSRIGLEVTLLRGEDRVPAVVTRHHDPGVDLTTDDEETSYVGSAWTATVDLTDPRAAQVGDGAGAWQVEVELRAGDLVRRGPVQGHLPGSRGSDPGPVTVDLADGPVTVTPRPLPVLTLTVEPGAATAVPGVLGVELGAEDLAVLLDPAGTPAEDWHDLRLVLPGVAPLEPLSVTAVPGDGQGGTSTVEVRFPRTRPVPGLGELPLPTGMWRLVREGTAQPLHAAAALEPQLPLHLLGDRLAVQVRYPARARGGLRLQVVPPLAAEESTTVGAARLEDRARRREDDEPLREQVLVWSAPGGPPSETVLAVTAELLRRPGAPPVLVGVRDHAAPVPEGATAVVQGSRAWWQARTSSRLLVSDHVPRSGDPLTLAGQRFVQLPTDVWSGLLGRPLLESRQRPEVLVEERLERVRGTWTDVLAANEPAAQVLRESFAWPGDPLVLGDPGLDGLLTADRAQVRRRVLGDLGHDPGAPVLLLLAQPRLRGRRTLAVLEEAPELDPAVLADLLPDWLVLRRGPIGTSAPVHPRVHDVSRHPRPHQLLQVADVCATEETPLTLAWAATGRPTLLHRPEGLLPVAAAAPLTAELPGHVVTGTDEVAALLADGPPAAGPRPAGFTDRWLPRTDGQAAARVVDLLLG